MKLNKIAALYGIAFAFYYLRPIVFRKMAHINAISLGNPELGTQSCLADS
jgi:hypothetical protein